MKWFQPFLQLSYTLAAAAAIGDGDGGGGGGGGGGGQDFNDQPPQSPLL